MSRTLLFILIFVLVITVSLVVIGVSMLLATSPYSFKRVDTVQNDGTVSHRVTSFVPNKPFKLTERFMRMQRILFDFVVRNCGNEYVLVPDTTTMLTLARDGTLPTHEDRLEFVITSSDQSFSDLMNLVEDITTNNDTFDCEIDTNLQTIDIFSRTVSRKPTLTLGWFKPSNVETFEPLDDTIVKDKELRYALRVPSNYRYLLEETFGPNWDTVVEHAQSKFPQLVNEHTRGILARLTTIKKQRKKHKTHGNTRVSSCLQ